MSRNSVLKTHSELVAALRARREALGLSGEAVDHRVGWADRYCAKLENPEASWGRGRGGIKVETLLEWAAGLDLGLALVPLDADQVGGGSR